MYTNVIQYTCIDIYRYIYSSVVTLLVLKPLCSHKICVMLLKLIPNNFWVFQLKTASAVHRKDRDHIGHCSSKISSGPLLLQVQRRTLAWHSNSHHLDLGFLVSLIPIPSRSSISGPIILPWRLIFSQIKQLHRFQACCKVPTLYVVHLRAFAELFCQLSPFLYTPSPPTG